jgi:HAD superfamily hydrolase (TIGR01484 family)
MRFAALATDYDATLAKDALVETETIEALRRLRRTGRRAILVTGRTLNNLREVFPCLAEFDSIVAENGGTLYNPATCSERLLANGPPEALVKLLRERTRLPFEVGHVIVATSQIEKQAVLESIQELGLEMHIIFNKGSLMILPSGVNKATGLHAALKTLGLSIHNVAGIGDAENDHALLAACELSAAVANALPTVKERVHVVTKRGYGPGVVELIDEMIADDLARYDARLGQSVLIGRDRESREVAVKACDIKVVCGPSGAGKSTFTTSFLESLSSAGYQFCAIDAEGDYELFPNAVVFGNADHVPTVSEIAKALSTPTQNVIVNLLGLEYEHRPAMFQTLFSHLEELRSKTGRPHCLILDEAHHFIQEGMVSSASYLEAYSSDPASGLTVITVNPERLPAGTLKRSRLVVIAGDEPLQTLQTFCARAGLPCPDGVPIRIKEKEMLGWRPGDEQPFAFSTLSSDAMQVRHRRKYAEGELAPDRSFYFRGPAGKLNLRAHNLITFLNMMNGVDEETWLFHLRSGDYSDWFRKQIKDDELADLATDLENNRELTADQSRSKLHRLITERYTLPQ